MKKKCLGERDDLELFFDMPKSSLCFSFEPFNNSCIVLSELLYVCVETDFCNF